MGLGGRRLRKRGVPARRLKASSCANGEIAPSRSTQRACEEASSLRQGSQVISTFPTSRAGYSTPPDSSDGESTLHQPVSQEASCSSRPSDTAVDSAHPAQQCLLSVDAEPAESSDPASARQAAFVLPQCLSSQQREPTFDAASTDDDVDSTLSSLPCELEGCKHVRPVESVMQSTAKLLVLSGPLPHSLEPPRPSAPTSPVDVASPCEARHGLDRLAPAGESTLTYAAWTFALFCSRWASWGVSALPPLPAEEPPDSIRRHSEAPDAVAGVIASSGCAPGASTDRTEHGGSVLVSPGAVSIAPLDLLRPSWAAPTVRRVLQVAPEEMAARGESPSHHPGSIECSGSAPDEPPACVDIAQSVEVDSVDSAYVPARACDVVLSVGESTSGLATSWAADPTVCLPQRSIRRCRRGSVQSPEPGPPSLPSPVSPTPCERQPGSLPRSPGEHG